ncbi:hypothetical protein [Prochlorococcus marinus]|uniref:hypothetical protein n=1 Tax=Prochlorococcus marinus TaxID=1219 RepID=UPI0001900486|nr:hypothetical protein [Prochlorococcus marinus]EEE40360.1 conserved hypothetical protein [Prochlorococcus marinus str. MIT 9202]
MSFLGKNYKSRIIFPLIFFLIPNLFSQSIYSRDNYQNQKNPLKEIKLNKKIISSKNIGIGKTIQEAKLDAALNAITSVVGTYLDIKKEININSSINNIGVQRIKNISQNYLEFNRGNILSIDVLSVDQKNNLFYVKALVRVIEENIQEYVDEFSFGKRKINLDIKTIRDTNKKLNNNITYLMEDLFQRKNSTNYKYIKLGKENFLGSFNYQSYCKENLENAIGFCEIFKKDFNLNDFCWLECEISDREMIKKEIKTYNIINDLKNKKDLIIIPFKISIRNDYKKIYHNVFDSISQDSKSFKNEKNNLLNFNNYIFNFVEDNNLKSYVKDSRLIIFNDINDQYIKSYFINNKKEINNYYPDLFSEIKFKTPTLLFEIKDQFGKTKTRALILKPHFKFNNNYICENNLIFLLNKNPNTKCNNQEVKYLKVFPTLNHFPISKTKDFSLLNNTYYKELELAPIVINSEENFVLILNINEFNLNLEDTISLKFISLEDSYKLIYEKENSQLDFDQRDLKFGNNIEELKINLKRDNFINKFLNFFTGESQ